MTDVLHVEQRDKVGSAATKRLRQKGRVAAVLYGHGEPNSHLSIPASEVDALLRHHGRTVQLAGGADGHALLKSVQWDPLGIEVLHLDFYRVSLDEAVEISVGVELKGDAPGLASGGVLTHNMYEIVIRCPAGRIPESLNLLINDLQVGQHKYAKDVPLPEGATLVTPPDTVLVSIEQHVDKDDTAAAAGSVEPEVIKRPTKDAGEG